MKWAVALIGSFGIAGLFACSLGFGDGFSGGEDPAEAGALDGDFAVDAPAEGTQATDATDAEIDPLAEDPDLVAWWKLDETSGTIAKDSSRNHNDATLFGTAGWTAGHRGGALSLPALGDNAAVPPHPSLDLKTTATISFWVRIDSGDFPWLIAASGLLVRINTQLQASVPGAFANASHVVATGSWHHVAVTYDVGTVAFYIDGVQSPTSQTTFTPGTTLGTGSDVTIATSGTRAMTGAFDEIRIYRRILSSSEIATLAK